MICFDLDPFTLKRNVARSLNSQMVFEYIQERFRTAYRYFACPQSLNRRPARRDAPRRQRVARTGDDTRRGSTEEDEDDPDERLGRGFDRLLMEDEDEPSPSSSPSLSPQNGLLLDGEDDEGDEEQCPGPKQDTVAPEDLHYIFDRMIFTGGKVSNELKNKSSVELACSPQVYVGFLWGALDLSYSPKTCR